MSEFAPSSSEQPLAGFNRPQKPKDLYTAGLYEKYELGGEPSLADIEPIATELLGNPTTIMEGMCLVLGRDVDAREISEDPELAIVMLLAKPTDKFGLLLLMHDLAPSEQSER